MPRKPWTQERKELETSKATLENEVQELQRQLATRLEQPQQHQKSSVILDEVPSAEPELLHDPYHATRPLAFLKHPPGFKLGWKNPHYRDNHRSWMGWKPITYDSEIGQELGKYLTDPPRKMAHKSDNLVRRGDLVLCVLPEKYWEARNQRRAQKANKIAMPLVQHIKPDHVTAESFKKAAQHKLGPGAVVGAQRKMVPD